MSYPTIVVAAYNRIHSLERLLDSVYHAKYPNADINLIISIDKGNGAEVLAVAKKFVWSHGSKIIIEHKTRLGLKEHILACGDFALQYGSVIILEDDLLVSPYYYEYACSAKEFYEHEDGVAGVSLFNYQVSENGFAPFLPFDDGYDVYFIQTTSSWGQLFFAKSWKLFRLWLLKNSDGELPVHLPQYLLKWSKFSWKKYFNHFLIEQNQYFVFPRISLSTNFGEPGTNTDRRGLFQVSLLGGKKDFRFVTLENSFAVYDSWFEIKPEILKRLSSNSMDYDLTVDLFGTKPLSQIKTPYLLSSKPCSNAVRSFANDMVAPVENIIRNIQGNFFHLAQTSSFRDIRTDISTFYISTNSISQTVFNSKIQEGVELYKFQKEFPLIQVLVHCTSNSISLKQTINSILSSKYPLNRIMVYVFYQDKREGELTAEGLRNIEYISFENDEEFIKKFVAKVNNSEASYYVTLNSGDMFFENALNAVSVILGKYSDIHWITGIETALSEQGFNIVYGNTAMRRWNSKIFERNLYKSAPRFIPSSATFWTKHLWDIAKSKINFVQRECFFNDLWLAFFKVESLHVSDVYMSASPHYNAHKLKQFANPVYEMLVEDGFFKKIMEFCFINNIPYFRSYYKNKNNLCPVIRFDYKMQNYFLSEY